jgi:hypothetical protein
MDAGGKASICRFTIHKVKIGDFSFSGFGILSDFFILEIISISIKTGFLIPTAEYFFECLNLALRLIYIKAIHGHAAPIDGDWIGFVWGGFVKLLIWDAV